MLVDRRHATVRSRVSFSASVLAIMTASAAPALAGCLPYPTQPATTTNCEGANAELLVNANGATLVVQAGASVSGAVAPAITTTTGFSTVRIDGTVSGSTGILVQNAPRVFNNDPFAGASVPGTYSFPFIYPSGATSIVLGNTGRIEADVAIRIAQGPDNGLGDVSATLDNSGTIISHAGAAVQASNPKSYLSSVVNHVGGSIAGIDAAILSLDNDGLIDGGTNSALAIRLSPSTFFNSGSGSIDNSGTIKSLSASATVASLNRFQTITNSGAIVNDGTGNAIEGAGSLNLQNSGEIVGGVLVTNSQQVGGSTIFSIGSGRIAGNVQLGGGDDMVVAKYLDGTLSISGTIDGGAGSDSLDILFLKDAVLTSPFSASNFESLGMFVLGGASVTLAEGFSVASPIASYGDGSGTIINNAVIELDGPFIAPKFEFQPQPSFVNNGSITTNLAGSIAPAISLLAPSFRNTGTISAIGGDAVVVIGAQEFENSGSISATGTAANFNGFSFVNSGTILSQEEVGLRLSSFFAGTMENSGTIQGAVAGVELGAAVVLTNSGTIRSEGTGVVLNSGADIYNTADSVISGGINAIAASSHAPFALGVYNAGTINGNVDLGSASSNETGNVYVSLPGGVLTGSLHMGNGRDIFVTDIANAGSASVPGVTGEVTGQGLQTIFYRVAQDASATPALSGIFDAIGYQLLDGAHLTLNGGEFAAPLSLTGTGSVDISANLSRQDQRILLAVEEFYTIPGEAPSEDAALAITSSGELTFERSDPAAFFGGAVQLSTDSQQFINTGTIRVRDSANAPFGLAAVFGGAVTNTGSILLDGANGVASAAKLVNSGTISHAEGTAGFDVLDVTTVINSGTIGSIHQSARARLVVDNRAGGTIGSIELAAGGFPQHGAIAGDVHIINAGTIEGNLLFKDGSGQNIYVNAGGQVTGNLGAANPSGFGSLVFINRAAETGVGGTIDAGLGFDTFLKSYSSLGNYDLDTALPVTFEIGGVEALGGATVVTLTSADNEVARPGISIFGNGAIVNEGSIGPASPEGTSFPPNVFLISRPSAVSYGGVVGESRQRVVQTFTSSGFVISSISYGGALAGFTNNGMIDGDVRVAASAFHNNGSVDLSSGDTGTVIRAAADADFIFTNSGTIEMVNSGIRRTAFDFSDPLDAAINIRGAIDARVGKAVSIDNSGVIAGGLDARSLASSFVFSNGGTISGLSTTSSSVFASLEHHVDAVRLVVGATPFSLNGIAAPAATVTISNKGLIDGGFDARLTSNDTSFVNEGTIRVDAEDIYALSLESGFGGDADEEDTAPLSADLFSFLNAGTIEGAVELGNDEGGGAKSVNVANSGTISVANPGTDFGGISYDNPSLDVENVTFVSNTITFENSGTISNAAYGSAAVVLSSGAGDEFDEVDESVTDPSAAGRVVAVNSGTITTTGGDLFIAPFGQGGLSYVAPSAGLVSGARGPGATSVTIANTSTGVISALGAPHFGSFFGGEVTPLPDAQPDAGGVAVAAVADTVTIRNDGRIVGGPAVIFDPQLVEFFFGGDLGDEVDEEEAVTLGGVRGGAIDTFASKDLVTNTETGTITGGIALRSGDDRLENYGSIDGDVYMGDGDDIFVQGIRAVFLRAADGGAGIDSALVDITGGGTLDQTLFDRFFNFENLGFTGTGQITTSGVFPVSSLNLMGGQLEVAEGSTVQTMSDTAISGGDASDSVVNKGTIQGNVALGNGDDVVDNRATINGNVALGDGSDQFVFREGATVTGTVNGGPGTDKLRLSLVGGEVNLAPFQAFEELDLDEGTGSFSGTTPEFEAVNVNKGSLTGKSGSMLMARNVVVGREGRFGSAGKVKGNVSVMGTLSPGASPGTMTIDGDVTLATGSATLFEMTPTVSDAIIINGALTIASGATLTLTGERPLTPGLAYDLIVADDGITGSFTTVNKAAAVQGFVRQASDRIQLLGTFQLQPGSSAQVGATVTYLNSLLIAGTATSGLAAAAPSLVASTGFADPAEIARLHPEPYASASQIGVENGLALVSAARSVTLAAPEDQAGLFGFGQGFGAWRRLPGDFAAGTAKANVHSRGLLGGIGFGSQLLSVGAFIGYVDARQRISALGASTDADGVVAGLLAEARLGGFELGVLAARDGSSADSKRSLANGATASSHYKLRGWTFDLNAGYRFPIGGGWTLRPEAGVTHISSRRGAASESGAGALGLDVDARRTKATFVSGGLTLHGAETAQLRPWLSAGLRHQLDGRRSFATASLTGVSASFTVPGVVRSETLASVSGGVSYAVSPGVELFASGNSEFGADSSGEGATAGLRLRF